MKNFTTFLSESSQFNKKKVEEFLVAIAYGLNDFEWQTGDRDFGSSYDFGEGDFFTCVRKAKRAADESSLDAIGTVCLEVHISAMILFFSMIQRRRNGH